MEYKTGLCLNTTISWDFRNFVCTCTTYAHKSGAPFAQSSILYSEKLHSLTVKKISFGINFCSYLIGSFQNFL